MKLTGRDAQAFFRKPDPSRAGVLLFGEDAMRVAHRRQEVIAALVGPEGEAEMRNRLMTGRGSVWSVARRFWRASKAAPGQTYL